jgi:hypothetical protein
LLLAQNNKMKHITPTSSQIYFFLVINIAFFSTSKLQDEIKIGKFEFNKFHASKKDPFY